MRRLLFSASTLLIAGCATVPSSPPPPDRAVVLGSISEAFSCAMRLVNELHYTVTDADREAGFLRAERDRTSLGEAFLQGVESVDQLTLSLYPGTDQRIVLRVVAGAYEVETRGERRGSRISRASSAQADQDVQTILRDCGEPIPRVHPVASPADPRPSR